MKIDLTGDEITVLKMLVEASMNTIDVKSINSDPASQTVGELLLKKFESAVNPQGANHESELPAIGTKPSANSAG